MARFIIHVDMDAFFAAVEERDNPRLRGEPIVVGAAPRGGKGRGVVSTCSYAARRFGIHSAMPISRAFRLCPGAVFIKPDMRKYMEVSQKIYDIFYSFTPCVEALGIDEAFLDVSGSRHLFGSPRLLAESLQKRIKEETALSASIGLAPNKFIAKIASDLKKPEGFVEVKEEDAMDFLRPLAIGKMWGVGKKAESLFNSLGIKTIGALADMPSAELELYFGKTARELKERAAGVDARPLAQEEECKSLSNEFTFQQDTNDMNEMESVLMALSDKLSSRLRREGLRGRTITLKVRFFNFSTFTRAVTLPEATNFCDDIFKHTRRMLRAFGGRRPVRLLGVRVNNFSCAPHQMNLFDGGRTKKEKVHEAVDRIRRKFGNSSIIRARAKI